MRKLLAAVAALAFMAGCTSEPTKPAEPEKPKAPEAITGRSAFQKCFVAARGWQRDAQPYHLESETSSDFNGHDGKAGTWRANFASPGASVSKPYMWSNGEVSFGSQDTFSPTNSSTAVFDIAFLKIDSDQAFDAAQKHGGDKLLEKDKNTPVFYVLDWNRRENLLVWHVIYGTDRDNAKLRIAVNASTGDFMREEK
jgi:hypothetical protein